jgi:hypothetical protein
LRHPVTFRCVRVLFADVAVNATGAVTLNWIFFSFTLFSAALL